MKINALKKRIFNAYTQHINAAQYYNYISVKFFLFFNAPLTGKDCCGTQAALKNGPF